MLMKKKFFAILIAAIMILTAMPIQSFAAAAYAIHSVYINGTTATVTVVSPGESDIVVGIYDRDGDKMLGSGTAHLENYSTKSVSVQVELDYVPAYYHVKVFLLGEDHSPLCKIYETDEYNYPGEIVSTGTLAENVTYTWYDDGEFIVSGTGEIPHNIQMVWTSTVSKITIEDGITSIGDYAFATFHNVRSVTIGNSVKSIGTGAFKGMMHLAKLTIGNSVTSIGDYAFKSCETLGSVIIPDSVKTIGIEAFYDCKLTGLKLGNSVTTIKNRAFYNASFTSLTIPDSVVILGTEVFRNNPNLENVKVGTGVTILKEKMFYNCPKLSTIALPASIIGIEADVFFSCGSISTIYYAGSTAQWKSIDIDSGNSNISKAKIFYDYTLEPEPETPSEFQPPKLISDTYVAGYGFETFDNAVSGNTYTMLIIKDKTAKNLLAPENLLYIAQAQANSRSLTFKFGLKEDYPDYDVIFSGVNLSTLKPTEHIHEYTAVVTPATCTEDGYTTYTCFCGESYIGDRVSASHHYTAVITNPTCTQNGRTDYTCSVCGDTYSETIPATGHIPGAWTTITAAEIGKTGLERQSCTICGAVINERVIPALKEPSRNTLGDVNGDGKINASDARLALRISAQIDIPTADQFTAADTDGNGKITASDARKILRVAAQLDSF